MELFLNSVPILASLTREEKMMLVDALEEQAYPPSSRVINQVCTCLRDMQHSIGISSIVLLCTASMQLHLIQSHFWTISSPKAEMSHHLCIVNGILLQGLLQMLCTCVASQ